MNTLQNKKMADEMKHVRVCFDMLICLVYVYIVQNDRKCNWLSIQSMV